MAKVSLITDFTNGSLFTGENFTSTTGATSSSILTISAYDQVMFYGIMNNTGAAGLAATVTAEISPNGTNFFPYGSLWETNAAVSLLTFNTGTTRSFSFVRDHIGGINSVRFTLTIANQIASTSFSLRFSARKRDV